MKVIFVRNKCSICDATVLSARILRFGHVACGVLGPDGKAAAISPLFASSRLYHARPPQLRGLRPSTLPRLDGEFVWSGAWHSHFGHFITETFLSILTALPALSERPDARLLFVNWPSRTQQRPVTFPAHVKWFLERVGISESRISVLDHPVRVENLVLPEPAFSAKFRPSPAAVNAIDALGFSFPKKRSERLFLSRSKLPTASRNSGNAEIEVAYEKAGFDIVYPEELSIEDQIARICAAEIIAGENGSALHWSLYSPHIQTVVSFGWRLALQRGICRSRGQRYLTVQKPLVGSLLPRSGQHVPLKAALRALRRL